MTTVSLDAIKNLNSNSSYYLSSSGEIKKTTFNQWFKCLFNIGNARQKVANLVDVIKRSLDNASTNLATSVEDDLLALRTNSSIKGSDIKRIAAKFQVRQYSTVARQTAKSIIGEQTEQAAKNLLNGNKMSPESLKACSKFLCSASDKLLNKLPYSTSTVTLTNPETGLPEEKELKTLNHEEFRKNLSANLEDSMKLLNEIIEQYNLTEITPEYLDYAKSKLFSKGERNNTPVSELKDPDGARMAKVYDDARITKDLTPDVEKLVKLALAECGNDKDLRKLTEKMIGSIVHTPALKARSEEEVTAKVKLLKENLAEIKRLSVSYNNPEIYKIGLKFLTKKGLKVKPELFAPALQSLYDVPLDHLKRLNRNSSLNDVHEGVQEIKSNLEQFYGENRAFRDLIEGKEDETPIVQFADSLMLLRLNPEEKAGALEALTSRSSDKLECVYQKIAAEDNTDISPYANYLSSINTQMLKETKSDIMDLLSIQLGKEPSVSNAFFGRVDFNDPEYASTVNEINCAGKNQAENLVKNYLDEHFQGAETGFLREFMYDKLMSSRDHPNVTSLYKHLTGPGLEASLKLSINSALKQCVTSPEKTAFARDLALGMNVTLGNGVTLSSDFKKACDQLAQFVTGNEDAVYDKLEAMDKLKANLIMGVASSNTTRAVTVHSQYPLSDSKSEPLYTYNQLHTKEGRPNFRVSLDADGGLVFKYQQKTPIDALNKPDGKIIPLDGKQSYIEAELTLGLDFPAIRSLLQKDFSKFDADQVQKLLENKDNKQNVMPYIDDFLSKNKFSVSMDYLPDVKLNAVPEKR